MIVTRALKARAATLIKDGQHKGALAILRKLPADDLEAQCVMGELLMLMLRYEEATRCFERCMKLDPQSGHPHGVRARVMIRRLLRLMEEQAER